MQVERTEPGRTPSCPTRREFSRCQLLAGIAVVGLGAALARADGPPRPAGVPPAPQSLKPAQSPPMTLGRIRAEPAVLEGVSNRVCTATNAVAAKVATNAPAVRLRGEMPAETTKK